LRSQPTNNFGRSLNYPYTTIDDDGKTPVVVMTIEQANAINKKFRDMESTIKIQMDTITKYEQKVVFVETVNTHKADSLSRLVDELKIKVDSLQFVADTIYKWADELNLTIWEMATGPSLLYMLPPYNEVLFLNLDYYNMYSIDNGDEISLVRMSDAEFKEWERLRVEYNQKYYPVIDYGKALQFRNFEERIRIHQQKIWKNKNLYEKELQIHKK